MRSLPGRSLLLAGALIVFATVSRGAEPVVNPQPAALLRASVGFGDRYFDEKVNLLWSPAAEDAVGGRPHTHRVRESIWYALGLMQRNAAGDRARAFKIIDAVLAAQIHAPGEVYHGTFQRSPEEPAPRHGAKAWTDYDPNWRQFIGTAFALFLLEYPRVLPAGVPARLLASIELAIEGEIAQRRLTPNYTNIALMHGFLWSFAAERLGREEWVEPSAAWAESVHRLFAAHGTFEEYNSPTYYGVDLYGVALWRKYGPTKRLRQLGTELEAALWRDLAQFYHPTLRNLCGPFDRSYGMDMTKYVALSGVWMGLVLPADRAPMPDPLGPMDHAHDFLYTPLFVLLGARVPDDVLPALTTFVGEHAVQRTVTADRSVTAWLAPRLMLGGETTNRTHGAGTPGNQFHPATVHWLTPEGAVGWILLRSTPPVDATATANRLVVTAEGNLVFRISAPGITPADLTRNRWTPRGLRVEVESDAVGFEVDGHDGYVEVTYRDATRVTLHPSLSP